MNERLVTDDCILAFHQYLVLEEKVQQPWRSTFGISVVLLLLQDSEALG